MVSQLSIVLSVEPMLILIGHPCCDAKGMRTEACPSNALNVIIAKAIFIGFLVRIRKAEANYQA